MTRKLDDVSRLRFLTAEYSDDLASLTVEGLEAEFFRKEEGRLEKTWRYLADEKLRQSVAARGGEHVVRGGHDVVSRISEAIRMIVNTYPNLRLGDS